jgi:insertion element IS1 protein InsB
VQYTIIKLYYIFNLNSEDIMVMIKVCCPVCKQNNVVTYGLTPQGKQRYRCKNLDCKKNSFILDYTNKAYLPEVKEKIIEMTMNSSGIRDCARVLGVSQTTVIAEIKKRIGT